VFYRFLVIAIREELARMSTSILRGDHALACLGNEILEFESLDEVGIPDHGPVFDSDLLEVLHDLLDVFAEEGLLFVCEI
jgi:hypothetical protein